MGNFASRIHSKEDGKIYNILPLGDMPTVVFGRVIKPNSVPGMQYYFSDGRVKFQDGGKEKRDNMSNGGGWNAVIPFTKEKKFSAIKIENSGESILLRRYKNGDRLKKGWYAWVHVIDSNNKDIDDTSIDWYNIVTDYETLRYTDSEYPEIGGWDVYGNNEILDVGSVLANPTQLPVIFTVPEDLDFSKMNDVEYVKQFCRTAVGLNANTMSHNFIIRNGKIICAKGVHFESNKILSTDGKRKPETLNPKYKTRFSYKYLRANCSARRSGRYIGKYKMYTRGKVTQCIHNEFSIIPIAKRNSSKFYKSINEYKAYRYGTSQNTDTGHFRYWKWKLK